MNAVSIIRKTKSKQTKSCDFLTFLNDELLRRCEKNPSYSLRAFARALGVHHTFLSRVLSGKRAIGTKLVSRMCESLMLSPTQTQSFLKQIPNKKTRKTDAAEINFQEFTVDIFNSIAEWYHDAILELTHVNDFKPDLNWIARKLGITHHEAKIAKERLLRLELLEVRDNGEWIDISRNNTTNINNDITSSALRKYQKNILEKSILSLEEDDRSIRDHSSTTFAIDANDIPELKEKIRNFRYEIAAFVQRPASKPNSVYQLSLSLFPITKQQKGQ